MGKKPYWNRNTLKKKCQYLVSLCKSRYIYTFGCKYETGEYTYYLSYYDTTTFSFRNTGICIHTTHTLHIIFLSSHIKKKVHYFSLPSPTFISLENSCKKITQYQMTSKNIFSPSETTITNAFQPPNQQTHFSFALCGNG